MVRQWCGSGPSFLHTLIGELAKEFGETSLAREPWTSSRLSSKEDAASEGTHSVGEMVRFGLTLDSLGFELALSSPLVCPYSCLAISTQVRTLAQAYQSLSRKRCRGSKLIWSTVKCFQSFRGHLGGSTKEVFLHRPGGKPHGAQVSTEEANSFLSCRTLPRRR